MLSAASRQICVQAGCRARFLPSKASSKKRGRGNIYVNTIASRSEISPDSLLGKLLPEELGFDSINNYKSEIELLAYYRHDDSATFPRVIAQTKGAEHLADCFDSKRSAFEIVLAALVRRALTARGRLQAQAR